MENLTDETKKNNEENPLRKWIVILGALAFVFLCTTIYFAFFAAPSFNTGVTKLVQNQEQVEAELNKELADLMAEHDLIKEQYGNLVDSLSEKDSVIMANAAEIQRLIAQQADYNRIKKQLQRLQKISQEYVAELDKLYAENTQLKEENTQLNQTLTQTRQEKQQVVEENQNLTAKINTEATLRAYNIKAVCAYNKSRNNQEVETTKASKARKIKTTLTLAENSLISPGTYNVYCRVSVPGDGRVLTPGKSDAYTFMNEGQKLQYTAKAAVNYVNKAEQVTLVWDIRDNDKAIKGTYIVQVFSDNGLLGETRFTLD